MQALVAAWSACRTERPAWLSAAASRFDFTRRKPLRDTGGRLGSTGGLHSGSEQLSWRHRADSRPPLKQRRHDLDQFDWIDRLREMVFETAAKRARPILGSRKRRQRRGRHVFLRS